jgi:hypothetical protein
MSTSTLVGLIIVVAAIAFAAVMFFQRQKTLKLKTKFGPEYDRLADREGSPRRAEAILDSRQKRVEKFHIRPLSSEECDRFSADWRAAQEQFVDDPLKAVTTADQLVNAALRARGYPMGDFEQQAADISVEHPRVVADYRAAHDIATQAQKGDVTTEDLRGAMQHYRHLFEHVLDAHVTPHQEEVHR